MADNGNGNEQPMRDLGYTRGRKFLLTRSESEGERSQHLHYLLPDGKRRKVTVDQAYNTLDWQNRIGEALSQGRTGRRKGNAG